MSQRLLFPESVLANVTKTYNRHQCAWLWGGGTWPLSVSLGCPTEEQAIRQPEVIRNWIEAWRKRQGVGEVSWSDRRWRQLGTQNIPDRFTLASPLEAAKLVGDSQRWQLAVNRCAVLHELWPCIHEHTFRAVLEALTNYEEGDFERLIATAQWFSRNQSSGLYPRQLPIRGIDTKWLEEREAIVVALFDGIVNNTEIRGDTYERLCLKRPPDLWRLRILDSRIQQKIGGLADISSPLDDLCQLAIAPNRVFIVENLQTFLAFEELDDAVVILGKGFGANLLGAIPWLCSAACFYWGDIDTHGFAILSQARSAMPAISSILMNEETLLEHKDLWSKERRMNYASSLPHVTLLEAEVYNGLKQQRWGTNVRLEQERIPWHTAWKTISSCYISRTDGSEMIATSFGEIEN